MKKTIARTLLFFLCAFLLQAQSFKPVLFKLKDIKDVSKTAATNGQILAFISATGLWTPTTASGTGDMLEAAYADGSGHITAAAGGTAIDSSALSGLALITAGTWSATVTPSVTSVTASGAVKGLSLVLEGGANDTTIVAGAPSAAVSYTWPAADGAALQVLQTDGAAALAWATMPSLGSGTTNYAAYWSSSSAIAA